MTKFQLNRPDAPWEYPLLGFIANTGTAILDGSLSTPPITVPPDAFWSVYVGGSAETGITRYTFPGPTYPPTPETSEGFVLTYSQAANTYVPTDLTATYEGILPTATALAADTDVALESVRNMVLNSSRIHAQSGNRIGNYVVNIPPGTWTSDDLGAMLAGAIPGDGRRIRGVIFQGAGRYTTTIVFNPASAGYLFDNQDRFSRMTFRDMTFQGGGANAGFMNSVSNGGPQAQVFERIVWEGTWSDVFHLTGTDTNSEFSFFECRLLGTITNFIYNTDVQALNFNFFGCDMEPDAGNICNFQVGGNINVWGGSWIGGKNNPTGAGAFFVLGPSTSSASVNRLLVTGVRTEYRSLAYKFLDSQWSGGEIAFLNLQDGAYQSDLTNQPSTVRMKFSTQASSAPNFPSIRFVNCGLAGKHEYVVLGQADAFQQSIVYDGVVLEHWSTRDGFIVQTFDASVTSRIGAALPIQFINRCRSGSNTSSTLWLDGTLNWHRAKNALVREQIVSFHGGFGSLPNTADSATDLTLTVPLNSWITGLELRAQAGSSPGTDPTWALILKDGDGTVVGSIGGADIGADQTGNFVAVLPLNYRCNSTNKTQLTLTSNAAAAASGLNFLALLKFYG